MGIHTYHDLLLVAGDVEKDQNGLVTNFCIHVFDSPVGQGEKREIVTIPNDFTQRLRFLEKRDLDEDIEGQMDLGEVLAGLLLPPYARQMFSASLNRLGKQEGLRLRLRLADELSDFPWEYMYIQDTRGERTSSSFLALDPRISIVRDMAMGVPPDGFGSPSLRRILVAMASPEPYNTYHKLEKLPDEQKSLKTALDQVVGIQADYLPDYEKGQAGEFSGATVQHVTDRLMRHDPTDIFHFSGHGVFTKRMGPAFGSTIGERGIVLADENNQAVPLAADRLGEILRSQGIRLVVLGACETGRRDGYNVWSSVVASLLKARIPAVVAMQFTINDQLAAAFSGALYRGIVAGFPLDAAVVMGRAAIRIRSQNGMKDARDWGVPVLYLRPGSGVVFNPVTDKKACQAAKEDIEQIYEQHIREVSTTGRMIGPVIGTMKNGTITVDQTMDERVSGVVIGDSVVSLGGGKITIRQKADVVDGVMIGGIFGKVGGGPTKEIGQAEALAQLQDLLRMDIFDKPYEPSQTAPARQGQPKKVSGSGATCPSCHKPVECGWKFCSNCRAPQPAPEKFCVECGAEFIPGTKFCTRCGKSVF